MPLPGHNPRQPNTDPLFPILRPGGDEETTYRPKPPGPDPNWPPSWHPVNPGIETPTYVPINPSDPIETVEPPPDNTPDEPDPGPTYPFDPNPTPVPTPNPGGDPPYIPPSDGEPAPTEGGGLLNVPPLPDPQYPAVPTMPGQETGVSVPGVPDYPYYSGQGMLANPVTGEQGGPTGTASRINADGSITLGDVGPHQRTVQPEELTSEQLSSLLASDSKYMQDARRQGLEQANAMGGLGGTAGIGASMTAALRAGLPIAESDAQAYRTAATENLAALNQFSQLNLQRASQLELMQLDNNSKLVLSQINASVTMATAKLNSATQRDISKLDAETQLRVQEMAGDIQATMAGINYAYTVRLNDQMAAINMALTQTQGEYGLEGTRIGGAYDIQGAEINAAANLANLEANREMQRQSDHANMVTNGFNQYTTLLQSANGMPMDDPGRARAIATAESFIENYMAMVRAQYPEYYPEETEPSP